MSDNSIEIWKRIPGFSAYEASSLGRVRRRTLGSNMAAGTLLRLKAGSRGYPKCGLTSDSGERVTANVHVIIAKTFLGDAPDGKPMVLHRDDVRTNNAVSNLRWGNGSENKQDAIANGRIPSGENHPSHTKPWTRPRGTAVKRSKLTEEQVVEIFFAKGRQRDLAIVYGVNQALIQRIRVGKVWRHITDPVRLEQEWSDRASKHVPAASRQPIAAQYGRTEP